MFAASGAGDVDALLETVHPDSRWTYYGANPRRTKAEYNIQVELRESRG